MQPSVGPEPPVYWGDAPGSHSVSGLGAEGGAPRGIGGVWSGSVAGTTRIGSVARDRGGSWFTSFAALDTKRLFVVLAAIRQAAVLHRR